MFPFPQTILNEVQWRLLNWRDLKWIQGANLSTYFCFLPHSTHFRYLQLLNLPESGSKSPRRTFNHYKALSRVEDGGVSLKDEASPLAAFIYQSECLALCRHSLVLSPRTSANILFCIVFRWSWHELNSSRYCYFFLTVISILRMTYKQLPGLTELARTSERFKHSSGSASLALQ